MKLKIPGYRDFWPMVFTVLLVSGITGVVWWRSLHMEDAFPVLATTLTPAAPTPTPPAAKVRNAPAVHAEVAAVAAVAAFAQKEAPEDSPAARESTAEGMRLLAAAIGARGNSILWRDRAKRLGETANEVEHASDATLAADLAHDGLLQAAEWIVGLPRLNDSGSRDAIVAAAKAIREDEPLRNQSRQLEAFFDAAALALGSASI